MLDQEVHTQPRLLSRSPLEVMSWSLAYGLPGAVGGPSISILVQRHGAGINGTGWD
jgi:hypothetical protein